VRGTEVQGLIRLRARGRKVKASALITTMKMDYPRNLLTKSQDILKKHGFRNAEEKKKAVLQPCISTE